MVNTDEVTYCELCEMELAFCTHGLATRRASLAAGVSLLISPTRLAHFPGCPHKADDPDFSEWAELDTPNAWQRLGNGEQLRATGGARQDLVAEARCRDCVDHGPR